MARQIIHVDMDEFFAAVEKLDRPDLRGRPLLVGGDPRGRGVVSTASYEARPYGCRSGMPMVTAIRLCPHAVVLPVRFERYHQMSDRVFAILERFSPLIEPLSIDEAFLDATGCERLLGPAERIATEIKRQIRHETQLTASLGVAPNKFLAKLASDLKKPDGLVVITEENAQEVLDPLPVSKIWGVGPAGAKALEKLHIRTIGQLRRLPESLLLERFGEWGLHCHQLARGLDNRPVARRRDEPGVPGLAGDRRSRRPQRRPCQGEEGLARPGATCPGSTGICPTAAGCSCPRRRGWR